MNQMECRSDYVIASDCFLPRAWTEEMDDIRIETIPRTVDEKWFINRNWHHFVEQTAKNLF